MTTIVTRLLADPKKVAAAAEALKPKSYKQGFPASAIMVVDAAGGAGEDHIRRTVVNAGVPDRVAGALVKGVLKGGSLIIVRAPWGRAADAIAILDAFGPFEATNDHNDGPGEWHDASPLSALLGLPVIFTGSEIRTAPLTSTRQGPTAYGLPLLASNDRSSTKLTSSHWGLSSLLGIPTLLK